MAKFNPMNHDNPYDERDLSALKNSGANLIAEASAGSMFPGLRLDAADNPGVFFAQQLAYVKNKAYDKQFPELSALRLFPMTSDVDEGAEYFEYFSYEPVGMAQIIANYADDLPRVDVKGEPHRARIVGIGDSYGYNVQEMRAARRNALFNVGKPLDARRAEAARRAYDVRVNHLLWNGDPAYDIVGVLSSGNNIPVYTLAPVSSTDTSTSWEKKDIDAIAADIGGALRYIDRTTKGVEKPDSIILPNDVYTMLELRRIPGTSDTAMTYLQKNCKQIKNWENANELSKDNTEYNKTGSNICMIYTKDAEKMAREAPMPFKQHPVQTRNLEMVVNCEAREAGMQIYLPFSACLMYGL